MGCLFIKGTLKEVSMNGHSSNIGYNIFISLFHSLSFFSNVYLVGSTPTACTNAFFMLNNLIFIIFRIEKFYSHSYCL